MSIQPSATPHPLMKRNACSRLLWPLVGVLLASASLQPAAAADAYSVMAHDGRFRTWTSMINIADLQGYARGKRPYTIFAPVETSMANIDPELMKEIGPRAAALGADTSQMTFVVQTHVAFGKIGLSDLSGKVSTLPTVNGKTITVDATRSPAAVSFAGSEGTIAGPPIVADNAVIYPVLITSAHFVHQ